MILPQKILDRLDRARDDNSAIELLQGAVRAESITGNEKNFVDYLEPKLLSLNLSPKRADFAQGRPNIWGERSGTGQGRRLLFIGHTDTVHVDGWAEKWSGTEREDPFGAPLIDGKIWGRGTGDLKAGICASLAAIELIDRAGIHLKGDISVAFVGDEESGEEGSGVSAGIKHYSQKVLDGKIEAPDFAVYVEPTKLSVFAAQMGFFIADVKITGKSAYFGTPEKGVDALRSAHKAMAGIWKHSDEIAKRASHELVGRGFVLITEIKSGGYIAVPGECSFSLIRKLLPGENLDDAVNELEAVIHSATDEVGISVEIAYPAGRDHSHGGSPAEIDSDLDDIKSLSSAVANAMEDRGKIAGAPFWSESPFLIDQIGCPAVYCAPGDITNCHTLEERVNVDEYLAAITAFATFIVTFCGIAEE